MKSLQKCSAHCPGRRVAPSTNETHACCQPRYVTGNLKVSSLEKHPPDIHSTKARSIDESSAISSKYSDDRMSCYEKFALAKRLHAANLEHQPLPDKVDDEIFRLREARHDQPCRCSHGESRENVKDKLREQDRSARYGPVLGCKKPETRMDLAICWETPIDDVYEPHRPTHIDGTEGGLAPAIFALVDRTSSSSRIRQDTCNKKGERLSAAHSARASDGSAHSRHSSNCQSRKSCRDQVSENDKDENLEQPERCRCCDNLCKNFKNIDISKSNVQEEGSHRGGTARKCVACQCKGTQEKDPRLIRSAVGESLGMQPRKCQGKLHVPRPRTPFARRSFCIDTLTAPFSVVSGRRNADYPEHWRLMSIYQQSYRNPKKRRHAVRY